MNTVKNRYEFVYLFDVENGNPNGDPDAGNMPRIDPETGHGIVTDVCLKRKVRNYIEIAKAGDKGYNIYVREKAVLNQFHERAYKDTGIKQVAKKLPKDKEETIKITRWMCDNFYDIRTFGAVMTTEVNCGQVRGPVQFNFAKSIDPIMPQEVTITRVAVTNVRDLEKERTMGRKHIVPYGLYKAEGYISPYLAKPTGFSEKDLELLWDALINMFDHDHSAARGKMSARKLIVFKHDTQLGNAPSHILFDLLEVRSAIGEDKSARNFSDYEVRIDRVNVPSGVTLEEKI